MGSNGVWDILEEKSRPIRFHLGKLIFFQPLTRLEQDATPPICRYQIIIIDEKAKNKVVVGSSLDFDAFDPYGEFFIGSKSIVLKSGKFTYHLKVESTNL